MSKYNWTISGNEQVEKQTYWDTRQKKKLKFVTEELNSASYIIKLTKTITCTMWGCWKMFWAACLCKIRRKRTTPCRLSNKQVFSGDIYVLEHAASMPRSFECHTKWTLEWSKCPHGGPIFPLISQSATQAVTFHWKHTLQNKVLL